MSPLAVLLALALAPDTAAEPAPFEPLARFETEAACDARLGELAQQARRGGWIAVEGPYRIADGDRRIHSVRASVNGHAITETRCLGTELSTRSWRHSIGEGADEPETIESMAAKAEWLKPDSEQR